MTIVADKIPLQSRPSSKAARDQIVVAGGQIAAGIGNMAFSLVMARLLTPGAFAQMASFLALYLILSMPGTAITAAIALEPNSAVRARPFLVGGGALLGISLAIASPWLGPAIRLPVGMVVVLGLSCPALGTLALERGRLYAGNRRAQLVGSFLAEPVVRLGLGLIFTVATGRVGGALAVVVGGYAALEIARRRWLPGSLAKLSVELGHIDTGGSATSPSSRRAAKWAAFSFLALVVVQNQDLLLANRTLSSGQAGVFAVLSTLGGLAAFATMTIPLMLLPRSGNARTGLLPAIWLAILIGAAAVGIAALMPGQLVGTFFGARYEAAAPLLVPYMVAMALLGIDRVLVAHRCAIGAGRSSLVFIACAIATQTTLILSFGHNAHSVAFSTIGTVTGLTAGLTTAEVLRASALQVRLSRLRTALRERSVWIVAAVMTLGVVERFLIPRGLWLDEATSVFEARQPFGSMINTLRSADVHPPLYFSMLWASVRVIGSNPLAVRIPSIIAGTLVIPMMYLLGKEAYDRRTGFIAAFAGSTAPIMVWYSQEARMYALLMLFGVIAMWAQLRIIRGGGRGLWVIYALSSAALVWTQYFGAFQIAMQQLAFLYVIVTRRRQGRPVRELALAWATTLLVIVVCIAPLLPFAYQQFMVNQTGGKGFGGPQNVGTATALSGAKLGVYSVLANLIWAVWGYQPNPVMTLLGALWPLGMLFVLVLLGRRHRPVTTWLVLGVAGPGLALFGIGLFKRDLFDIRYLSTVVPILFILMARMISAVPRKAAAVIVSSCILASTLVVGLVDQQYNGANPRTYDFNGAMAAIEAEARPGDVVYYDPVDLRQVVEYYGPHLILRPLTAQPGKPVPGRSSFVIASASLMNGASNKANLTSFLDTLRTNNRLIRHRTLPNVETWEFR